MRLMGVINKVLTRVLTMMTSTPKLPISSAKRFPGSGEYKTPRRCACVYKETCGRTRQGVLQGRLRYPETRSVTSNRRSLVYYFEPDAESSR